MIKYKAFYKNCDKELKIYFKCKSKDVDEEYIPLFVLDYQNNNSINDKDKLIIDDKFYKVSIYADVDKSNISSLINIRSNITKNTDLNGNSWKILDYKCVFKLHNFFCNVFNSYNDLYLTPYNFVVTFLIRTDDGVRGGNNVTSDVLLKIIGCTLMYWDD